ncbi:hypothetical protein ACSBR1_000732 [Camellia fascicularis]
MSSAYFTGTLPDFSSMGALRSLDLSYNLFSGDFPVFVTNLTILKALNLNENEGFKELSCGSDSGGAWVAKELITT